MPTNNEKKLILQNEITTYFNDRQYKLITDVTTIVAKKNPLEYICLCGSEKHKAFKEILSRNCRECENKKLKELPTDMTVCPNEKPR